MNASRAPATPGGHRPRHAAGMAARADRSGRRLHVTALLVDLCPGPRAPPRDQQPNRYAEPDHAGHHQDHADGLEVEVLAMPGHRELQDRTDDDQRDAPTDGHNTVLSPTSGCRFTPAG